MAHAASATIWRDPNFAEPVSAPVAASGRFAAKISVARFAFPVATGLWPVGFGRASSPLPAAYGPADGAHGVTRPTSRDQWLQIDSAGI